MDQSLTPADWQWIKAWLERLRGLNAEHRAQSLAQAHSERPELAPTLEVLQSESESSFGWTPERDSNLSVPAKNPSRRAFGDGERIANRYRVRSCVGAGGMGEVYLVEDSYLPVRGDIALKTVRGDLTGDLGMATRFEREVRHALQLAHRTSAAFLMSAVTSMGHPKSSS